MTCSSESYWFTCPNCHRMKALDDDQANGRVSIQCDEGCDFHETGIVRPLIPTTQATKPEEAPSRLWPIGIEPEDEEWMNAGLGPYA